MTILGTNTTNCHIHSDSNWKSKNNICFYKDESQENNSLPFLCLSFYIFGINTFFLVYMSLTHMHIYINFYTYIMWWPACHAALTRPLLYNIHKTVVLRFAHCSLNKDPPFSRLTCTQQPDCYRVQPKVKNSCSVVGCIDPGSPHGLPTKEDKVKWPNFFYQGNVPASKSASVFVCASHSTVSGNDTDDGTVSIQKTV